MIFSYNWLKDYTKRLAKPEKLAELLSMKAFEVGGVKRIGEDFVLDIDVLPNRASDCFSHIGIARECSAFLNSKFQVPDFKLKEDKELKVKDFVSVEVKDKTACQRYTARVVVNVKVGPSPKWIKQRLKVCGLRPINNIVDIANYVMLETGQPLHAFDGQKLEGGKIIVRFAKEREKIVTLEEQKFDLTSEILVIADEKKPIGIAGIKGGKIPEINKKTKIVVLESANFNPQVIRKGSRKLNLKTDASLRFEHGIDPNLTEIAINRAVYLIQKIARGKAAKGLIDLYPKKVFSRTVKLDLNYLESLLGLKIPEREIRKILESLGFKIKNRKLKTINVIVPTFRPDISLPEDLIEEIGRITGFEKIKATFPTASLIPSKRNLDIFWEDLTKNILKEAGFTEVYNYSFISEKEAKVFGERNQIEVANPISLEQKYLRPSLIPNLLKNVKKNQRHFDKIRIFELGKTFKNSNEARALTGLILGDTFYQVKGVVDLLLNKLGISKIWYGESKISVFHPQKAASIKVNGQTLGFLGEVSLKILDQLDIQGKVVLFDIDFEKLSTISSEEQEYRPLSKFPSAVRDIAVLVPRGVKVVEVLNKINALGGKLIRDIDLFDVYQGEELPGGKKNLAFHIIYQSENKTLSSKEIDKVQKKIIKFLERNPEWQVRK